MLFLSFQSKFNLNLQDPWIHRSLLMNLKNCVRQRRHFLKKTYFNHCQDRAMLARTLPPGVNCMTHAYWCKLVDKWSTTRNEVLSLFTQPCHCFNSIIWTVANLFILFVCVDDLYESQDEQTGRPVPWCHRFS